MSKFLFFNFIIKTEFISQNRLEEKKMKERTDVCIYKIIIMYVSN